MPKKARRKRYYHFYMGLEPKHWHTIGWWILILIVIGWIFFLAGRITGASLAQILASLYTSLTRVLAAYIISLMAGAAIALLITKSERVEDLFLPIFETAQGLPSTAIIPLVLIWLGGYEATVLLLVITMIWPITFSIVSGIKTIKRSLAEAATIFGASGIKRFRNFTLPVLLPSIITGSTIGWGEGWEVIVAAEVLGEIRGIGTFISNATASQQYTIMTLALILLMFMIFLFNKWLWVPLLKRSTSHLDV